MILRKRDDTRNLEKTPCIALFLRNRFGRGDGHIAKQALW